MVIIIDQLVILPLKMEVYAQTINHIMESFLVSLNVRKEDLI